MLYRQSTFISAYLIVFLPHGLVRAKYGERDYR